MKPIPRRIFWPTLMTLIAVSILSGLGVWQLERRIWKQELNLSRTQLLDDPAFVINASNAANLTLELAIGRRVILTGRFIRPEKQAFGTIFLSSQSLQGQAGVHAITPFEIRPGIVVLVDRGWLPASTANDNWRQSDPVPDGPVMIEGIVRFAKKPNQFTPDNDVAGNQWYWIDPASLGDYYGLPIVPKVFVVLTNPLPAPTHALETPTPRPDRQIAEALPDHHLQYALTWFSLAGIALVIYGLYLRRVLRRSSP